jgi:energy-coupling factor transport system permease protein
MSVFLYVERESALHRLHPVTKVVGLLLGFAISLIFTHPLPALGAFVLALVALAAAGGLGNLARAWKFLLVLFIMTTLIWSVFLRISGPSGKGGIPWALGLAIGQADIAQVAESEHARPVVTLGDAQLYTATRPIDFGLESRSFPLIEVSLTTFAYGVAMALRVIACLVFGLAFLSCTRTEDFALALRNLGAPQGVSVAVSLAFRLVPTLVGTARNVIEAQRARGVDPAAGNVFRRIRNYVPLITPVLAYALRGADMTAMALESRGLGRDPAGRTHYRAFKAGATDALLIVGLLLIVVLCILARVQGYGVITFGT